ncbi:lipid-transfer protein [Cupriavidus metallidurans]|uniref:lipid-transfer protein n=1 Tax=Cupriavidus TaxID=106589 RepID=UPI0002A37656|nr:MULTISPECIES: lipid-transfer protein [Cupriavidus]EKZ95383.1 lipid-transfer protein [Cupriavidus sp. HMR-1]QWC90915.1 lipid-transfer protein [Cupriavidus metallidurans]GMG95121.1 putative lipid-transfer protein Ltp1 [Cupriavidus sp. TKC]HBO78163.1 lipid-transfer protein [Cupriavidus sp.]
MTQKVVVAGVGMIPFKKPGQSDPYTIMGAQAVRLALADAGVGYESVQQAFASYVFGDSTSGQRVLYDIGMTGIPVINVHNNCASGSTALYLANQAIASGMADIVLAFGFEQMNPGALGTIYTDRPAPLERFNQACESVVPEGVPPALQLFGAAGLDHMKRFGTPLETFAKIRAKASRHAANNPMAVFRTVVTPEEVMAEKVMWPGVMTRSMACPPTCGAAAAVLCSEDYAKKHGLNSRVWIAGQALTTDGVETFKSGDLRHLAGFGMSRSAADKVYAMAGIGAEDVDVVELHDCFAQNELLTYEALGLCPEGGAAKFVDDGDNTYGGRFVVNPSGGLLSKGHPIGATGLAQCTELVMQLRGQADRRQVEGARVALQHNVGIGGAAVVTMYRNA